MKKSVQVNEMVTSMSIMYSYTVLEYLVQFKQLIMHYNIVINFMVTSMCIFSSIQTLHYNMINFMVISIYIFSSIQTLHYYIMINCMSWSVKDIDVNAMILSAQFWPAFREEKVCLPDVLQNSLDQYTKIYETLKGNRTLNWKPHLGTLHRY